MAQINDTMPHRRGLLKIAAIAVAAAAPTASAAAAAPAGVFPEIAGAIADYWARRAEANAPGASDETIDAKSDEMDEAAARLAALPGRGVADLAAKVVFFAAVADREGLHCLTKEEEGVLASVEADALALAGLAS